MVLLARIQLTGSRPNDGGPIVFSLVHPPSNLENISATQPASTAISSFNIRPPWPPPYKVFQTDYVEFPQPL